eukprot:gene8703-649_t
MVIENLSSKEINTPTKDSPEQKKSKLTSNVRKDSHTSTDYKEVFAQFDYSKQLITSEVTEIEFDSTTVKTAAKGQVQATLDKWKTPPAPDSAVPTPDDSFNGS